jgi:hypothetical protein
MIRPASCVRKVVSGLVRLVPGLALAFSVAHTLAIDEGHHANRMAGHLEQRVLPFFTKSVSVTPAKPWR